MMEIVYRGQWPRPEKTYDVTCSCCDSKIRFKESESKKTTVPKNTTYLVITCPVCNSASSKEV